MENIFKGEITRIIGEVREKFPVPDEQLLDNGTVYYMNGNDGTDFDFSVNNRLCEFMVFYSNSEMGFIKILVNSDNSIDVYIYDDGATSPKEHYTDELECVEAKEFALVMYNIADLNRLWDMNIDNLKWLDTADGLLWGNELDYDEDDYDEDYDEDEDEDEDE